MIDNDRSVRHRSVIPVIDGRLMLSQPPAWFMLIAFLGAIGPLIIFHELGHYWVARWFGVGAEAFSIGFGKEIAGWTDKRGTRWKVGLLPLGGYVKFIGDASRPSTTTARFAPPTTSAFTSPAVAASYRLAGTDHFLTPS